RRLARRAGNPSPAGGGEPTPPSLPGKRDGGLADGLEIITLARSLRVAFESRGYDARDARRSLEDPHRESFAPRARWDQFRQEQPHVPIPESIAAVRGEVLDRLRPALDHLPT